MHHHWAMATLDAYVAAILALSFLAFRKQVGSQTNIQLCHHRGTDLKHAWAFVPGIEWTICPQLST
jgi:hypothetical protein